MNLETVHEIKGRDRELGEVVNNSFLVYFIDEKFVAITLTFPHLMIFLPHVLFGSVGLRTALVN